MTKYFTPDEPIHFKHVKSDNDNSKYFTPDEPIHFKHVKSSPVKYDKQKLISFKDFINEERGRKLEHIDSWSDKHENGHLGDDDFAVTKHMETHHDYPTSEHRIHTHNYTMDSSTLNNGLIHEHKHNKPIYDDFHSKHDNQIKHLDDVTTKPIGKELHVYSGLGFDPREHFSENHRRSHLHLPAYTSTSSSKRAAVKFAKTISDKRDMHILHVHMKETDKGHYVGTRSNFPEEHETILPRNTKLKVSKTPERKRDDYGNVYHIWHAKVEN